MKYVAEILIVSLFCIFSFSLALDEKPSGYKYEEPLLYDTFPEDFMWGAATAAYQVKSLLSQLTLREELLQSHNVYNGMKNSTPEQHFYLKLKYVVTRYFFIFMSGYCNILRKHRCTKIKVQMQQEFNPMMLLLFALHSTYLNLC